MPELFFDGLEAFVDVSVQRFRFAVDLLADEGRNLIFGNRIFAAAHRFRAAADPVKHHIHRTFHFTGSRQGHFQILENFIGVKIVKSIPD